MRRRDFIKGIVGSAAAWPLTVRAQQSERTRRIDVLIGAAPGGAIDSDAQPRVKAFQDELQRLGWTDGRNVRIDYRWSAGSAEDIRRNAAEIIALDPDVIITTGASVVGRLLQLTRTVPMVFTSVVDQVGAGIIESLARPGGNVTGFAAFEYSLSGKWLELLKQIAPDVKRAAVLRDAAIAAGIGQFAVIQSVAPSLGIDVTPVDVRDAGTIERAVGTFARSTTNGGLIVSLSALAITQRDLIIALAARHRLPAVYARRIYVDAGGLISYGPDVIESFRRAAGYVDRILRGENPADLPVQEPTKYELVINLKTAKALGLTIPPRLLTRADEVIE